MGRSINRAFAGIATLIIAAGAAAPFAHAQPQHEGYFYMGNKERIPMALEEGRIAVFKEAAINDDQRAADTANEELIEALDAVGFPRDGIKKHAFRGWSYANVPAGQRANQTVEDTVANLVAQNIADFVSPVFLDEYGPRFVTRDILVGFHADLNHDQADQVVTDMNLGQIISREYSGMHNLYLVRSASRNGFEVLDKANAAALRDEVAYAEPDMIFTVIPTLIPNDPMFSQLWGIRQASDFDMDGDEAWDTTIGSSNVITVVMDDGVDLSHSDLDGNIAAGIDTTGSGTGGNHIGSNPCEGHGTNVAGTIAAEINNSQGVVGIAPGTRIGAAKFAVLNQPCDGTAAGCTTCAVNAVNWTLTIGAKILNVSYSIGFTSSLDSAFQNTRNQGVVHFASTGNSGAGTIAYPASSAYVLGIGSVDQSGSKSSFSQFGTGISHMAPGSGIRTTNRGGGYATVSGTSFSSPYAAGVGALVASQNPFLTAVDIQNILQSTCQDMGNPGYDTTFGYGLTNARAAVLSVPAPSAPGAFNLQTPSNGATNVIRLPTFEWSGSQFATNYELTIDDNSDFSSPVLVHNNGTLTNFIMSGSPLTANTTYYWKIVASNTLGMTNSTPVSYSFTTISVPPEAFSLTTPANMATGISLTPTFQWGASNLSESYTIQVDNDSDFSSLIVNANTTLQTFSLISPLLPGTQYFWRVYANNPLGSTLSTPASRSFTTVATAPQGFALQTPFDGSNVTTFTPTLNWADSFAAETYRIQVDDLQTFVSPEVNVTGLTDSQFTVPMGALTNNTRYYWRVFAVNSIGETASTPTVYNFALVVPTCCPGNADKVAPGAVTFSDVTTVLANFGNSYPNGNGAGDSDCNGTVNFSDVTSTLANFNNTCN
ncbi:MAG: S8 family serine peptidase [Phycisphaerae bacterium]|nr:S8 family serine peptidase [Phycisphaerae bacterium]